MQVSNYLFLSLLGFIISGALLTLVYLVGVQNNFLQSISIALLLCSTYLLYRSFFNKENSGS